MVVSAEHFNEITNGYEKQSSGLYTHKGRALFGGVDQPGVTAWQVGIRGQTDTDQSYSLVIRNRSQTKNLLYVRDDGMVAADQLSVATSMTLPPNSVGSAQITDGSITTADIAPNAIQQTYPSALSPPPAWNSATINTWLQTSLNVAFTSAISGMFRFEVTASLSHTANCNMYFGIGIDGANPSIYWYTTIWAGAANFQSVSGIGYINGMALGAHTAYLVVYSTVAGTLALAAAGMSLISVTEQKR